MKRDRGKGSRPVGDSREKTRPESVKLDRDASRGREPWSGNSDSPAPTSPRRGVSDRTTIAVAAVCIVLAALSVYRNSFSVPFLFDDEESICNNATIRRLWPLWDPLFPPTGTGTTVAGRPVLNFSFALNYAIGGMRVWSYHALNLIVHVGAALFLFGAIRRTLLQPSLRERFSDAAIPLAFSSALVWTVHPMQTESVTYLAQRAESLVGLFYLSTLYFFVRATQARAPRVWYVAAVVACLLGMASKEVMVSAPPVVFLYDRTFAAGSFRASWNRRRGFYVALFATWALLAFLVLGAKGRGGTAGAPSPVLCRYYALTQCWAIVHYLRLFVWPSPLVFDYGWPLMRHFPEVAGQAALLILLLAGTAVALCRWPVVGFLGAAFFAILAPSSSVVPVVDTVFEHRMYLPLAAATTLAVVAMYRVVGRRVVVVALVWAAILGTLTVRRNEDYRSPIALWGRTLEHRPNNARAHANLGSALFRAGRTAEAAQHYEAALRLQPDMPEYLFNMGLARFTQGRTEEAIEHYRAALDIRPDFAPGLVGYGNALLRDRRSAEAETRLREAIAVEPDNARARVSLGFALQNQGRIPEAVAQYERAIEIDPSLVEAENALGSALAQIGRHEEALEHYEAALRIDLDFFEAENNLAGLFLRTGRVEEALEHYENALRLRPDSVETLNSLGVALVQSGREDEGIARLEEAVRIDPHFAEVECNLGSALAKSNRLSEALEHYEKALAIDPDYALAHNNLAVLFVRLGRLQDAEIHYAETVRLDPGNSEARSALDEVRKRLAGGKE